MTMKSGDSMVSVVIPCYNSADDIGEAIESVLRQTRDEYVQEIIVVDDGSADHSETVIRRWEDRDERVRYIYQENQGPSVARNRGVSESNRSLIAFLDADDVWKPAKLEAQVPFLRNHPDVALLCSDYIKMENGNRRRIWGRHLDYKQGDLLKSIYLRGGPVMMSTVVVRREVFEEIGGFDPSILKGQDTDLWLRITAEWPIHHQPIPLVVKRTREGSVSEDMATKVHSLREITDRIAERYPRLEPYRQQRHAILSELLIRAWLKRGKQRRAREEALRILSERPVSLQTVVLFILSVLPLSTESTKGVLGFLGRVRGALSEGRRRVTEKWSEKRSG